MAFWPLGISAERPGGLKAAEGEEGLSRMAVELPMPRQVFRLGAGGLRRHGQRLPFIGLEVLVSGRVSELDAERRGAHQP